eukprot:TRINITY_DN110933_c0_g1_i1.p1 TRINITY_DN110933_c0_g1~~TRINITY_DN110933_c0_g1_i1.p1  ORF type:complete len:203 (+),score=32.28 TRINITY_DN110933_c0_g1_i1:32-640(+)
MSDSQEPVIKLIVLGDASVGKSCLLVRFAEDRFVPDYVMTIGLDLRSKKLELNGRKWNVQVWDTAGQERFRTITPAYYRSAMGVILTYDVTERTSFDNISSWMSSISEHGSPGVRKILVGNKSDLAEHRKVTREDGEALANRHGIQFFETSAKTGEFVAEVFREIALNVIEHQFAHCAEVDRRGSTVPVKPAAVRTKSSCSC